MPKLHQTSFLFLFFAFLIFCGCFSHSAESSRYDQEELQWLDDKDDEIRMVQSRHSALTTCDFTKGKWVFDQTYPLYDAATCPYLSTAVTCRKNGRPDSDYEKWRWKPDGCSIPRFDALDFLGRMRRKRIMLVGDSIMRNQWESLVCLVQSVVPPARKTVIYNGPTMAFLALDFEMSIEFWGSFPGGAETRGGREENTASGFHRRERKVLERSGCSCLRFRSLGTHSDKWSSWDFVMEGNNVYKSINPTVAYEKGLTTWAKWIDLNLDPRRTRVFFRSMSPRHNRDNGWKCHNQREPLEYFSRPHVPEQLIVLQKVVRRMEFPVYLQDITTMSALRRDGHPSVYGRASGDKNNQQLKDRSSDCSHWCLPGVPDTWNEILNAVL
ncbi:UNVERIFIED_CONTAM: protein trichome birefringence-like 36 [Sesamum latifolium]|uniref:Protein trichome birefringence-like 36 n=1 Tax=Sesamum latifolium TaxID=2727402 RepID=A0AAW2SU02_9LAMI